MATLVTWDILDILLVQNVPNIVEVHAEIDLSSDHEPILISFGAMAGSSDGPTRRRVD